MKNISMLRNIAILGLVAVFAAGCASTPSGNWWDSRYNCVVAGAATGAVIGAVEDSNHDAEDAVIGAVVGGALGALLCPSAEGDADGDGVVDSKDECPNTPAGVAVNAAGCELDSDGDGVVDSKDQCPGTPAGDKVDAMGCTIVEFVDSDGDGVADEADQCPNTPAGHKVDALGCHLPLTLRGVTFGHDSAVLDSAAKKVLDKIAEAHTKYYSNVKLMVAGHTNALGSEAYNMHLSQMRADSVRDYLVSKGVAADRLTTKGFGESQPLLNNSSDAAMEINRRVELSVN